MTHDPHTLTAFAPVPRQRNRSNGWKPQVQRRFIEAIADTGSVRAACRRVGRSDRGAYQLRRHPEGGKTVVSNSSKNGCRFAIVNELDDRPSFDGPTFNSPEDIQRFLPVHCNPSLLERRGLFFTHP